ncbi:hypothetical protein AgCh_029188 [Apium graveolens]
MFIADGGEIRCDIAILSVSSVFTGKQARKNGVANLYVKNIDSSITNACLHTIFSKYGTILSCKVAEENGKSKGFVFVQFDSEDSTLSAIAALHQSFLEGKQLYVSKFIKKRERENACEESNFINLYVKYLSEDVTEDVLRGRFSEYGNISSMVIMKDSAGVSKGFGFVGFNLHEDAKKAMEALNGAIIGKAQRKDERKDQLVYAKKELLNYHKQKLKASNLFVKNLNISIDDRKLEHIFGAYGKVTSARVMRHYDGFSKGFGFVNFSTVEEAKMALDSLNDANETISRGDNYQKEFPTSLCLVEVEKSPKTVPSCAMSALPEVKGMENIDVTDAVGSNIRIDGRGPEVIRIIPRLNEASGSSIVKDYAKH